MQSNNENGANQENTKEAARNKVRLLQRSFDLSPYLKEYTHEEIHPAWFLSSHTDKDKLRRAYDIAEDKLRGEK